MRRTATIRRGQPSLDSVNPDATAVVPVYRPPAAELMSVIDALTGAGIAVLVVDDGSPAEFGEVLDEARARGAEVRSHSDNAGIARGLNDGLDHARAVGAQWLLTVDQDSTLPDGYVDAISAAAERAVYRLGRHRVGAVAAGSVDDASGPISYPVTPVAGLPTTEDVIQSGTVWSVSAMTEVGGFDETLGIDAVDAAACLRLRESGRVIVLAEQARIQQRLGNAHQVRLFGRTVIATGHSPERRTTMVRNRLRLAPAEFRQSPKHAIRTLRRVAVSTFLAVTVEDDRWAKAKASARGLLPARRR